MSILRLQAGAEDFKLTFVGEAAEGSLSGAAPPLDLGKACCKVANRHTNADLHDVVLEVACRSGQISEKARSIPLNQPVARGY